MTDDESPRRRPGPDRLWTDPREEEEHTQWLAPKTAIRPTPPLGEADEPEPPAPERPLLPLVLLGLLIAAVLFGGGVLGASLLRDDAPQSAAALPAAPGAVAPDVRSRAVRKVYAAAHKSVVQVRVRDRGASASGTGFVIDRDGTIVTNAHVVERASDVQVRFEDEGPNVDGEVLGRDESTDLAVLRVDSSHTRNLKPLQLADSDAVKVGDLAIAIGYPLSLDRTLTQGIVSGVGRAIQAPNGFSIDKVIQTDAAINPGNSGGPLLDGAGRVIGVNSQIATSVGGSGNIGIGFAVPSNAVRQVAPQLRNGAKIRRAYLGVESATDIGGGGAEIRTVIPGSPAERGGLRPGDIVSSIDGQPVHSSRDVVGAIASRDSGEEVEIEVERGGAKRSLRVTLGTRPQHAQTSPGQGPSPGP